MKEYTVELGRSDTPHSHDEGGLTKAAVYDSLSAFCALIEDILARLPPNQLYDITYWLSVSSLTNYHPTLNHEHSDKETILSTFQLLRTKIALTEETYCTSNLLSNKMYIGLLTMILPTILFICRTIYSEPLLPSKNLTRTEKLIYAIDAAFENLIALLIFCILLTLSVLLKTSISHVNVYQLANRLAIRLNTEGALERAANDIQDETNTIYFDFFREKSDHKIQTPTEQDKGDNNPKTIIAPAKSVQYSERSPTRSSTAEIRMFSHQKAKKIGDFFRAPTAEPLLLFTKMANHKEVERITQEFPSVSTTQQYEENEGINTSSTPQVGQHPLMIR